MAALASAFNVGETTVWRALKGVGADGRDAVCLRVSVPAFDVLQSGSIKVSKHEATVELTTENPRVVALDRYFEPRCRMRGLGHLAANADGDNPRRERRGPSRSATRLIEKPADAWQRQMARDVQ
jgi:hypothetical protein